MTLKQKKLLANIGKDRTMTEAMLNAGYAPSTAHQQSEVIKSEGFEALLEKHLGDEKVMIAHEEGLEAMRIHGTNDNFIEIPDHPTRLKAAELAYKVKGRLKDSPTVQGDLNFNVTIVRQAVA